jgi:hypothetical protein
MAMVRGLYRETSAGSIAMWYMKGIAALQVSWCRLGAVVLDYPGLKFRLNTPVSTLHGRLLRRGICFAVERCLFVVPATRGTSPHREGELFRTDRYRSAFQRCRLRAA